MINCIS